jgi:hypothetical protein
LIDDANYSTLIRDCDAPEGAVWTQPSTPVAGESVTIFYNPDGRGLPGTSDVNIHYGYNNGNWTTAPGVPMTQQGPYWRFSYTIPSDATNIVMVFNHRGSDPWDNNGGEDFVFNVQGGVPLPTGFVITTPGTDVEVANATANFILSGIADNVTGDITWTNALTGTSGSFPAASPWTSPAIALDVGANEITLTGNIPGTGEQEIIASDNADNYGGEWSASTQGSGFANWQFNTSSESLDNNGRFIGDGQNIGNPAWGLYANEENLSEAKRPLSTAMAVGQTLRVRMKNGELDSGAGVGVALQNNAGDTLWQFFFNGGDDNYSMTGASTDISWTADGLDIAFTLATSGTFDAVITPIGSSTRSLSGSLESHADMNIALVRFWNYNAGSGSNRDAFFNDLQITAPGTGEGISTSATVTITRLAAGEADSNSDGVPDSWYQDYLPPGTDLSNPALGSQKLENGNGMTLKDSYLLGLDPSDPESTFAFDALNFVNGKMVIDWGSGGNRSYIMQHTPALSPANWQDYGDPIPLNGNGNGRTSEETEMDMPAAEGGFFRMRLWP